ncbi:MAG: hypothetical protein MJ233_00205 [Mycoplasmoidaceae bacterium]|nr:hypothetical protein [Mycoplasmoidaceae bacterium]
MFRSFASIENARKTNNMSYTAMTESLIQMAASQGIKLKRSRTANWNDINVMFEGMKRSFADYMLNLKFSSEQIEKIKTIAQNEFNVIMHGDDEGKEIGLLEKYQNGDPLSAMMEAKKLLAICFADVNENIGLMAAATKLSQFLQDYTITFDDSEAKLNQNRLDILEAGVTDKDPDTDEEVTLVFNQDAKNADISPFMNRIFKVVRNRDKQEVKFSRHLLHGYKITPILKNISKNEFSNVYTLDID